MDDLSKLNGRTVVGAEMSGDKYLVIEFDDGSKLEVLARGTEEQWLSVDINS